MMQLNKPLRLALIPALLLAVSGCDRPTSTPFPPSADVEGATEAKPLPTADIVTNPAAEARYNASVEAWGDKVRSAGVRVCLWLTEQGAGYRCGG